MCIDWDNYDQACRPAETPHHMWDPTDTDTLNPVIIRQFRTSQESNFIFVCDTQPFILAFIL